MITTPTVILVAEGPVEESGAPVASSQMLIVRLMPAEDEHLNLSYDLKGKK